jgi:uncharacterized protein (DUF305 family)
MTTSHLVAGFVGVVIGDAIIMGVSTQPALRLPSTPQVAQHAMPTTGMNMGMNDMTATLRDKQGSEFDRAFLQLMIDHHQGAIDMSALAAEKATHPEIKNLAKNIVTAQTTEIGQMRQWQKDWGYYSQEVQQLY